MTLVGLRWLGRLHRRRRRRAGPPAPWAARSRRRPPWAPSCASFRWGDVRQLDRVSRELLARAWRLGPDPATHHSPSTSIRPCCETSAWPRRAPATTAGARGYHPLLAVAAGTGDVLMTAAAGRANTDPRRRPLPASGCATPGPGDNSRAGRQRLLYPRSGRRLPPDGCQLTIGQHKSLRNLIEALPEADFGRRFLTGWTAPPNMAETTYTPFQMSRTPHRCGSSPNG